MAGKQRVKDFGPSLLIYFFFLEGFCHFANRQTWMSPAPSSVCPAGGGGVSSTTAIPAEGLDTTIPTPQPPGCPLETKHHFLGSQMQYLFNMESTSFGADFICRCD